ncbi:MAG: hypothetical protein ABI885_04555 [Gammaproteobacteria bacterium]
MNDVTVAAEYNNEESTEACELVELGEVSTDTKGGWGRFYDGGSLGLWG